MKNKNKGIYLHIPFCRKKCNYCDFLSFPAGDELKENYIEALVRELHLSAEINGKYEADSVYIGGGTPSALSPALLERLLEAVGSTLSLTDDCEFTVECNPGTLDREKIGVLKAGGVNRVSLGVQSLDEAHLKRLGRIHSRADVFSSLNELKLAGLDNINLDLMFSLPDQTFEDWDETLRRTLWFEPAHVSFYGLTLEEGTPMYEDFENGFIEAYEDDEDRELYYHAKKLLAEKGYIHYEISNAAKPGMESRHNMKYWTMMDYIGFGLGAHSFDCGVRFSNTTDIDRYISYYLGGSPGTLEREWVHENSEKDNIEEFMFTGLRLVRGVSASYFKELFGKTIESVYGEEFGKLIEAGFMEKAGDYYRFTEYGMDLANVSLMELL